MTSAADYQRSSERNQQQGLDEEQWTKHYDESTSTYYYHNYQTGISQWEEPNSVNENQSIIKKKPFAKKSTKSNSKIVPVIDSEQPTSSDHSAAVPPQTTKKEEDEESDQPKQNYLALAKIYEIQKPYREYDSKISCVLCHKNRPQRVLYPCQHRVICDQCLESEAICSFDEMGETLNGFCNCPLCGTILKRILPADDGREEEIYWNWVLEVKPPLPENFMTNFRHSAAIIQKVHIDENRRINQRKEEGCCLIS
jgi:hypothetical protein